MADASFILDPYVTHAVELGEGAAHGDSGERVALAQRKGKAVLEWLANECAAVRVAFAGEVILGGVAEVVVRHAASAPFVVLGRRGLTHEQGRGLLGKHFHAIAHGLQCPAIVGGAEDRPPEHLLLAYNGSARARRALACARSLQRSLSARLTVLAVSESDTTASEQWLEEARAACAAIDGSGCTLLRRTGDPVVAIAATVTEVSADCIVLGGYRHSRVIEFFLGSTVDRILQQIEAPIIIA